MVWLWGSNMLRHSSDHLKWVYTSFLLWYKAVQRPYIDFRHLVTQCGRTWDKFSQLPQSAGCHWLTYDLMVNTLVAYQGNQSLKCPLVTSSQFQSHAWWWTRFQLQLNARTVTWMSCQHSFSCYMHNNPTTASTEDLLELFIWICFSKNFPAVYDFCSIFHIIH